MTTKINTLKTAQLDYASVVALSIPLFVKRNQLRSQLSLVDREIERYKEQVVSPVKTEIDFLRRDGRIKNLLISASNPQNKCNFSTFSNAGQIQAVFSSPICKGKLCVSYTVCNEIVHLSCSETSPKLLKGKDKKTVIKKKSADSSTGSRVHKTKKTYDKSSETVSIVFTETGETFTFNVSEGVDAYKADLEKTFPKSFFEGRTDGTTKSGCFAGFKHQTFTDKFTNQ